MKRINIKIHNGKITGEASGYKGEGCNAPIEAVKAALGGDLVKEEHTEEASLTEDPVTTETNTELLA